MVSKQFRDSIRINIFTNSLDTGGAEKQAVRLAIALKDYYEIMLIAFNGRSINQGFVKELLENKVEFLILDGHIILRIIKYFQICWEKSFDVTFSYLLQTNLVGGVVGLLCGVKLRCGGIRSASIEPKKIFLQKLAHNYLNTLTVYNNYSGTQNLFLQGFKRERMRVIPNMIEGERAPILRGRKNKISILSVGRLHHSKDYITALKTMKILSDQGANFEYIIFGYGELRQVLESLSDDLALNNCVKIVPNDGFLREYYENADIYLSTSLVEGVSNSILEAMSYSLPIVATDAGDNSLLVSHGVNGYIVAKQDCTGLSIRLLELLFDYSLRISMGLESNKYVYQTYSKERFVKNYRDLIENHQ